MPGFFISNISTVAYRNKAASLRFVSESMDNSGYTVARYTLNKFMDDKLFVAGSNYTIITEGVFLNKKQLCEEHKANWADTVEKMLKANVHYFDKFRGNFSGAHYSAKSDEWVVYTDALGMKPVFYYCKDGKWIVSSDMDEIVNTLSDAGLPYSPDTEAAYDDVTYGFMIGERTLITEIRKLSYGSYLVINNGELTEKRYWDFEYYQDKKEKKALSDEQIIDKLDYLFKNAVEAGLNKDAEYGYKHLVTLSGGLDSRMTLWAANKLDNDNIVDLTFGESDCSDIVIAKQVSRYWQNEMLIKTLDGGQMLTLFNGVVDLNWGMSLYSGIAHSYSTLRLVNFDNFGLLHTGDVGDAIVGSFGHSGEGAHPGAYSLKLTSKLPRYWDGKSNLEKFKMTTRGFNGVGASKIVCENYVYCFSPFLYREFFEFCLGSIPESKRSEHYIYKKWVLAKYPEAAKIPLQRYNCGLMTEGKALQTIRKIKRIGMGTALEWALWKLGIKKELSRKTVKSSMNPLDAWYLENDKVSKQMDDFFSSSIKAAENCGIIDGELIKDMKQLYQTGNVSEKTQVITVLCAYNRFFLN